MASSRIPPASLGIGMLPARRSFFMWLCLFIGALAACDSTTDPDPEPTLEIAASVPAVVAGSIVHLTANATGLTAAEPVLWRISHPGKGSIDATGTLTLSGYSACNWVAPGECTVTITASARQVSDTVEFTILPPPATIQVATGSLALEAGSTGQLQASSLIDGRSVAWCTTTFVPSNPAVVAVDPANGALRGLAAGTATIRVTTTGECTSTPREVSVTVYEARVELRIMPDTPVITVQIGTEQSLQARFRTAAGSEKPANGVQWISSRPELVTVDANGVVRVPITDGFCFVVPAGSCSATVEAQAGGLSDRIVVSIAPQAGVLNVAVSAIELNPGENRHIGATATFTNGVTLDRIAEYESSDTRVAYVDGDGIVSAVGAGEATITVTCTTLSCAPVEIPVHVIAPPLGETVVISPRSNIVPGQMISLLTASQFQLRADVYDATGRLIPGAVVTWTSRDPTRATVDQNGLVTTMATFNECLGLRPGWCGTSILATFRNATDAVSILISPRIEIQGTFTVMVKAGERAPFLEIVGVIDGQVACRFFAAIRPDSSIATLGSENGNLYVEGVSPGQTSIGWMPTNNLCMGRSAGTVITVIAP